MLCHMTLRLEPATVEALDKLVEQVYQHQGLNLTRMDLIRQAVRQYIERETAEVRKKRVRELLQVPPQRIATKFRVDSAGGDLHIIFYP